MHAMTMRIADLDEARLIIDRHFYGNALESLSRQPMRARFDLTPAGPITIGDMSFGTDVRLRFGDLGAYHVTVPLAGEVACRQAGRGEMQIGLREGMLFQPEGDTTVDRWSADCRLLAVKIDPVALEEQLAVLLDAPVTERITFDMRFDLSRGRGESWLHLLRMIAADALRPDGLARHPDLSARLRETLLTGLLLGAGHQYRDRLDGEKPRQIPSRVVTRVVEAIRSEPQRPYTVSELARLARVSRRTLQAGFQRHLGTTPMAYLREVRLEMVHDRLREAEPGFTTVARIAHSAGFTHLGRFAASYRARYGIAPSESLRR